MQYKSSIKINKLLKEGLKITEIITNGKSGDEEINIIKFSNGCQYKVDNGSCELLSVQEWFFDICENPEWEKIEVQD